MRGTRNSGLAALGGIALAALLAVIGHLGVDDDLNPLTLTVSDYAVSDRGGVIDVAMVVLAAATAVLIPALRRAHTWAADGRGRLVEVLLAAWIGGLLLAAVVPTNEPGLPMDTAAYVHRYASVVAFLALPIAGWLVGGWLRGHPASRWVRSLALASLALTAAMVWSAYPGDRALLGLAERLLILVEVGVIGVVAVTLVRRPSTVDPAAGRIIPARGASAGGRLR